MGDGSRVAESKPAPIHRLTVRGVTPTRAAERATDSQMDGAWLVRAGNSDLIAGGNCSAGDECLRALLIMA